MTCFVGVSSSILLFLASFFPLAFFFVSTSFDGLLFSSLTTFGGAKNDYFKKNF